jgi:hypothetical protein
LAKSEGTDGWRNAPICRTLDWVPETISKRDVLEIRLQQPRRGEPSLPFGHAAAAWLNPKARMLGERRSIFAIVIGFHESFQAETHWKSDDNNPETASQACLSVMRQLLG